MTPPDPVTIEAVDPDAGPARAILRAYYEDIVSRYHGRPVADEELTPALDEWPSDALAPPTGLLLVARRGDDPLGCAGLRLLPDAIGEVTRLYVRPEARGRGVGERLMRELEARARGLGVRVLRMDTRRDLTEAQRLYLRVGYEDAAPFNDEPYADRWFAKTLE